MLILIALLSLAYCFSPSLKEGPLIQPLSNLSDFSLGAELLFYLALSVWQRGTLHISSWLYHSISLVWRRLVTLFLIHWYISLAFSCTNAHNSKDGLFTATKLVKLIRRNLKTLLYAQRDCRETANPVNTSSFATEFKVFRVFKNRELSKLFGCDYLKADWWNQAFNSVSPF